MLKAVLVQDRATGKQERWTPDGVFVFIGLIPNGEFLPDTIRRNDVGFVAASADFETSLPGVFATGDVRAGSTKQAAVAAGDGTAAALAIRRYLQSLGEAHHSSVASA